MKTKKLQSVMRLFNDVILPLLIVVGGFCTSFFRLDALSIIGFVIDPFIQLRVD